MGKYTLSLTGVLKQHNQAANVLANLTRRSFLTVTRRRRCNGDIFSTSTRVRERGRNACSGISKCVRMLRLGAHLSAARQRRSPSLFSANVACLGWWAPWLVMRRTQGEARRRRGESSSNRRLSTRASSLPPGD